MCLIGYPVVGQNIAVGLDHGPGEAIGIVPRANLASAFISVHVNADEVNEVFILGVYVREAPQRGAAFGSPGGEVVEDDRAAPQAG